MSDPHYASAGERARGDYEPRAIPHFWQRGLVWAFRHFVWMRHPCGNNPLLDRFLAEAGPADWVVVNGDLSCDSGFVGVSDEPAFESARQCLARLRETYGERLRVVIGDHELGKMSIFGGLGGPRLASWRRVVGELGLSPCWRLELGQYVLVGITSSLVALPVFDPELLPEERPEWERLRAEHLREVGEVFRGVRPGQRVILFSHDPTALPFLAQEEAVRAKLAQIEMTVIGHLHSNLFVWKSRLLSGMPVISFLGNTVRRYSQALSRARQWKPFRVRLCPALPGIELCRDGGWLELELEGEGRHRGQVRFRPLRRC